MLNKKSIIPVAKLFLEDGKVCCLFIFCQTFSVPSSLPKNEINNRCQHHVLVINIHAAQQEKSDKCNKQWFSMLSIFLSTTGSFPAKGKTLEYEMQ